MLFGLTWYVVDSRTNSKDWDFELSLDTFAKKLTLEYLRFENNNFYHNALGHVIAGGFHYNAWRANGFTTAESLAAATAAAAVWEVFIEYREVASISDMVVSTISSVTLGEAMHRSAQLLLEEPRTVLRTILATIIDSPLVISRGLDSDAGRASAIDDEEAIARVRVDSDLSPTFVVRARGPTDRRATSMNLDFHTRIYADPADLPRNLAFGSLLLELGLGAGFGNDGLSRLSLVTRHAYLGRLTRRTYADPVTGSIRGRRQLMVGLGSGFEHDTYRAAIGMDRVGIVNLIGPMLRFEQRSGSLGLALEADAFPDFGIVQSYGQRSAALELGQGTKASLRDRGYYYALGLSGRVALALSAGPFALGVEAAHDRFRSIQGLDRFQESITDDFVLDDQRSTFRGSLRWTPAGGPFGVSIGVEERRLSGALKGVEADDSELWVGGGIHLVP